MVPRRSDSHRLKVFRKDLNATPLLQRRLDQSYLKKRKVGFERPAQQTGEIKHGKINE